MLTPTYIGSVIENTTFQAILSDKHKNFSMLIMR